MANSLIKDRPEELFLDGLTLELPLEFSRPLALNSRTNRVEYNDGKGWMDVEVKVPAEKKAVILPANFQPPIFTSSGIWAFASINQPSLLLTNAPQRGTRANTGELQSKRKRSDLLKEVNGMIRSLPAPGADLAVWLKDTAFASTINVLTSSLVTGPIILNSVKIDGSLAEKNGYDLRVKKASGEIQADSIVQSWKDEEGVSLEATVKARAEVDLVLKLDPLLGGIRTSFTIAGKAEARPHITLKADTMYASNAHVLAIGPLIRCRTIPISLRAGGDVKYGVDLNPALTGGDVIEPTVLFSSLPSYRPLTKKQDSSKQLTVHDQWLKLSLKPTAVAARDHTYLFLADVTAERVSKAPTKKELDAFEKNLERAVNKIWSDRYAKQCKDGPTKVVIGGEDFGPNNTFVKALKAIYGLSRDVKDATIDYKDVETVVKDPSQVGKIAKEKVKAGEGAVRKVLRTLNPLDRRSPLNPRNW